MHFKGSLCESLGRLKIKRPIFLLLVYLLLNFIKIIQKHTIVAYYRDQNDRY